MKKWMSLGLCVLLLLSLTACGEVTVPEDANYVAAMAKLEEGNLTEAYDLFKLSADPKAAEMLEKFAFVPLSNLREDSEGMNWLLSYTYDEKGNLLSSVSSGDLDWHYTTDHETHYTYDEQGRATSKRHRNGGLTTLECWTYDEKGNELTWTYTTVRTGDEKPESGYTCTYDENGNLLSQMYWENGDEDYTYGYIYTYDEQNRLLTRDYTEKDVHVQYVYDKDGNYYCLESYTDREYGDVDYYSYYDKEDRDMGYQIVTKGGTVIEKEEFVRNEKGDVLSRRQIYQWNGKEREYLKTYTYAENGNLLRSQLEENGEIIDSNVYTYDAQGNMLTYETNNDSYWSRRVCTYDERGNLLTEQSMYSTGWDNKTYTYDAAGYQIQKKETGTNGDTTVDYTYDQWGNEVAEEMHRENANGDLKVMKQTSVWELRYYPNGVPEQVSSAIDAAQSTTTY